MTDKEIIQALHFESLPVEVQELSVEQAREIVELRVIGIVSQLMSDDQARAFEKIKDAPSDEVTRWIETEFTDIDTIRQQVLVDYIESVNSRIC